MEKKVVFSQEEITCAIETLGHGNSRRFLKILLEVVRHSGGRTAQKKIGKCAGITLCELDNLSS